MSKNIKLICWIILLGLLILIPVGMKYQLFQPTITKLMIAFLFVIIIINVCIGINRYMKKKNNN